MAKQQSGMNITRLKVKVTITTPMLGTLPANPDIAEEHAQRAQNDAKALEELEALSGSERFEKGMTVFARDEERRCHWWDYQIKGFFKEAMSCGVELGDVTRVTKWAVKGAVDKYVQVTPRRIHLKDKLDNYIMADLPVLQRPLRADTLQGPRICLASSEQVDEGAYFEFEVALFTGTNPKVKQAVFEPKDIKWCLDWAGIAVGFGQWRTGGFGRAVFTMVEA
jgi:hypothetical protein